MLNNYLRILLVCLFSGIAGNAYSQNGDNFSSDDKGEPMEIIVTVDRDVILNKNPKRTKKLIQVRTSSNGGLADLQDLMLTATSTGTNDLASNNLLKGMFFSFGQTNEKYSLSNVNNLWQGRVGNEIEQNGGNVWRDAYFDFFFDPEQIPEGVKPGTYNAVYQLVARSRNPVIRVNKWGTRIESNPFLSRVSELRIKLIINEYLIVEPLANKKIGIQISNLSDFKVGGSGYVNKVVRQTYRVRTNGPFNMTLNTATDNFEYTNNTKEKDNITPVNTVTSIIEAGTGGASRGALSKTMRRYQLTKAPEKNTTDLTIDFEISAENLRTFFLRAGTYTSQANIEFNPTNAGTLKGEKFPMIPFEIVVDPLAEVHVNKNQVDLVFQTAVDYQKGVAADISDNITLSSTTKYNLTVRAGSANFTGVGDGTAIMPCGLLYVGQSSSSLNGSPTNQVQLSTIPQNLLSGGNAVLDKTLSINYMIKPDSKIIKAKKMTYFLEVIYGITAL